MDIRWILAYYLFSVLLVLGDGQRSSQPATPKQPKTPKDPASSKIAATKTKQALQKNAPSAPKPSQTVPSTDPEICDLVNNGSDFALPSLQCTLQHLPEKIADKWKAYMKTKNKNESDLLTEICDAKKKDEDPDFMKAFSDDEKGMVNDTSVLCRIRHTTPSECKVAAIGRRLNIHSKKKRANSFYCSISHF
uniref:Putative isac anti-complement n=1 Tax=Ixodes ricinus TaxID=34613 RepID=A0A0K8R8N3_IXORI